jgi:hypothetical protein
MASLLFWAGLPAALVRSLVTIISMPVILIGGIYTLFVPTGTPSIYVWGSLFLVLIQGSTPIRLLGVFIARGLGLLNQHDSSGVSESAIARGAADTVNGAWIGFAYNGFWIQFAATHSGTWFIWVNWFLTCCAFWTIITTIALGWIAAYMSRNG